MANTNVTLVNDGGIYVPSMPGIPVVAGDTFSVGTSDGSAVYLFFSPDAAQVLSPAPANPFPIAAGGSASFAFTSSASGAYSVFPGTDAGSGPACYPPAVSSVLNLEIGPIGTTLPGYGGPHETTGPGS
jgi:hypothetical protein